MIKFVMTGGAGRRLLGMGLSAENVKRLTAGEPIFFDAMEFGLEGTDIVIVYGETEDSIKQELQKQLGEIVKGSGHEPKVE